MTTPSLESYKKCSRCKLPQPLSLFRKHRQSPDGRACECQPCIKAYMAERWKNIRVPELEKRKEKYQRERQLALLHAEEVRFRKFGVTRQWYEDTLESQGFSCAICGSRDAKGSGKRFHIDHSHSCCSEKRACKKCRRGLLCNVCNLRLGVLENLQFIEQARRYLARYNMTLTL